MVIIIFFILGIAAVIVKANTGIIIADWIIWCLFGISGLSLIIQIIVQIAIGSKFKKQARTFDKMWNKRF